jgi:hypothetical protein
MMRKKWLLVPVVILVMLVSAPPTVEWKFRTHGAVYGSRGIAVIAYLRIIGDGGVPADIRNNLRWDLIRPGSGAPDVWRMEPYFMDSGHTMTYAENQGGEWLLSAQYMGGVLGLWDNASYFLGIASHYWGDVTCYAHHDNARSYYEDLYGKDVGYDIWDGYHDHLELQVNYYRPKDPALIVSSDGVTPYTSLTDFVNAANVQLKCFIDDTMPPTPSDPLSGWFGDWISSRKIEESDYSVYHDGNVDNVHYGSKELVDMSTELVYSGWVYALGIQNNVSATHIGWNSWWSREHRTSGVTFYPFGGFNYSS